MVVQKLFLLTTIYNMVVTRCQAFNNDYYSRIKQILSNRYGKSPTLWYSFIIHLHH
jgi:hypothetical protein